MKRLFVLILSVTFILMIAVCSIQTRQDKVLDSLGKYKSKQVWTHGEFQDYTDFGIYTFSEVDFNGSSYFSAIAESDIETIEAFVDDFENWINCFEYNDPTDELVLNYSFDRSIVDTGDYFYIYEGENYPKYGCYDLWIFDSQTNTLYYFHNNI